MYRPVIDEVTERKMSQFREGSFGRLLNHDGGMPVYSRADLIPDFCCGRGGVVDPEVVPLLVLMRGKFSVNRIGKETVN